MPDSCPKDLGKAEHPQRVCVCMCVCMCVCVCVPQANVNFVEGTLPKRISGVSGGEVSPDTRGQG